MAAYLYNIPEKIRPFVTGEVAFSKSFKNKEQVRIHLKRNKLEIPQGIAIQMMKNGYLIGTGVVSFLRDSRSVK